MKLNAVHNVLVAAIKAHANVLLVSKPGIGKTEIQDASARIAKAQNFIMRPSVSDPTDFKGFPMVIDGIPSFVPFDELKNVFDAIMDKVLCTLFLDDLGQAPNSVQAGAMQLMDRLKGKVAVIAATNNRTDRAGVQGLLEPVKSRFATIINVESDVDTFTNHLIDNGAAYGLDDDAIIDIVSFIRLRPDLLHQFVPTQDLVNQPCPRTWVAGIGKIIMLRLPLPDELECFKGAIGEGPAAEFTAFRRVRADMPNLDNILIDPRKSLIPEKPSVLYAVATGLATKVNASNFSRYLSYLQRLYDDSKGEFAAMSIRDALRRNKALVNTADFTKMITGTDLGKLISGDA